MNLENLSLPNCKQITYKYSEDYNMFGNRRYSWFYTRDKKIERDYQFRYAISDSEVTIANEEINIAVTCLKGIYKLEVVNSSGGKGVYTLSGAQEHMIVVTEAVWVKLYPDEEDSQIVLMTDKKLEESSDEYRFSEVDSGITLIENETSENITGLYCSEPFCGCGITNFMTFMNYDTMRFANTFRGMYCQVGPREYSSLIRCTSGSADVYAIDLRTYSPNYRKSFVVHLDSINKAVFFQAGFAIGVHSKEENTSLVTFTNNYYDKKFQRIINISECSAAEKINTPQLVMSTIARYAEKLGEDVKS